MLLVTGSVGDGAVAMTIDANFVDYQLCYIYAGFHRFHCRYSRTTPRAGGVMANTPASSLYSMVAI